MTKTLYVAVCCFFLLILSGAAHVQQKEFRADEGNQLKFEPVMAKFVRLELSRDRQGGALALDEVLLFGPEEPEKISLQAKMAQKFGLPVALRDIRFIVLNT